MSLPPGVPAPLFDAPSPVNPRFAFGSLGGRYILLAFLPNPGPERDAAVQLIRDNAAAFHDDNALFFGVLPDAESYAAARNEPPYRWFADLEGELRRLYDLVDEHGALRPSWVLVDPMLRILGTASLAQGSDVIRRLVQFGDPEGHAGVPTHAPVLIVPRVFEASFCRRLIDYYLEDGGARSGTMIERDGKTVGVFNDFKSRRDATISDEALIGQCRGRVRHRLLPEIEKFFQFRTSHMERHIVGRYDAEDGGWFGPHRDNTTLGTAHRRFAVSINLNAEDFEGGDLRFAEFGRRTYRPPTGGAVVFSCSMLHEVTRVTKGARFAYLPFLYDAAGAEIREANMHAFDAGPTPEAASHPAAP